MSKTKTKIRYLCGDFETTVYDNQTFTEVWASVICELGSEEVFVFQYRQLYRLTITVRALIIDPAIEYFR